MEKRKKIESDSLKKGPLAKLHEKIQNKYKEMQRRLDKSRSVDSIATLNDEYCYKENRHTISSASSEKIFPTNSDFGELKNSKIHFRSEKSLHRHNVISEHFKEKMAIEEVFDDESSVFEGHFESESDRSPLPFFDADFKVSSES